MKIRVLRRITQVSMLLLLVAIPLLNKNGINVLIGSLYSMSIGPLWITDPLSGLQVMMTTLAADGTLLLSMALPVIIAFIFGRVFCSWLCPQNLLCEMADYIRSKAGSERLLKLRPSFLPRYVSLAIMLVLTLIAGFPVANLISAPGIISVQISEYIMAGAVGLETVLIGFIIIFEVLVIRRAWCNYVCPVGGMLGIFRTFKTLKVHYEKETDRCIGCRECAKACQLGLNPMGGKIYPLCHNCGDCIAACQRATGKNNPLSFKF